MAQTLLNNNTLKDFIEAVNINQEKKDFLISKLPEMDREERQNLFKALAQIRLLDLEEKEVLERIKQFWQE